MKRRKHLHWLSRTPVYLLAVVLALWVLIPIYLITLGAFSTTDAIYSYPLQLLPHHVSLGTLRFFINSSRVIPDLKRSVYVLALALGISLAIGVPAGYAISRFSFRGSGLLQLSVIGTRAFPAAILAVPLLVIFIQWHLDDNRYGVGVGLVHAGFALPFVVLTTASIFSGVSVELEEAAMTLGCTRASAVARVILPLALPGIAAAAIFVSVLSWNEVFAATNLTLNNRTLGALTFFEIGEAPLPFKFAGGFFLLAPPLVMIFFIRRFLFGMWGQVVK